MSQQKTQQGNTSTSMEASSLPSLGQILTNVNQTSVLKNMYSRVHLTISENNADEKGKAPMLDSPGEESFNQEFWNSSLFATGSDDKVANSQSSFSLLCSSHSLWMLNQQFMSWQTQHPGADRADKFELADPSENTLLMVDKCTAADHVFYEYPGISFVEYQNFLDTLEVSYLQNSKHFPGLHVQVNKTLQNLFFITMFAFLFIHHRRA